MKYTKKLMILIVFVLLLFSIACASDQRFTKQDLIFEYNGVEYELNADSAPLIAALGDDYTYSEAVSCAYVGMDKTFSYLGIDIYTYPLDSKDLIDEIYITSSDYKTKRGITVGSTFEEVLSTYGDDCTDTGGGVYVIGAPSTTQPCIYLIIQDDKVLELSIYAASNIG